MKKLFYFVLAIAAQTVCAQQLENTTFDGTWVDCHPWEAGKFVSDVQGTQPSGWCVANVNGMSGLGATIVAAEEVGRKTTKTVKALSLRIPQIHFAIRK